MTTVRARVLVVVVAVALGAAAERAAFDWADVRLWLPDLLVGWLLVGCGLVAGVRRPASRSGALMVAAGLAWFLGNFTGVQTEAVAWVSGQLVYLHRGFLVHLVVAFPDGFAATRRARVVIGAGYVAALVPGLWSSPLATVVLAAALVGYSALDHTRSLGGRRRARRQALWAAVGLGAVVAAGTVARATLPLDVVSRPALLAYQAVLCAVAVGLLTELVTSGRERTDVTDLVVELGTERSGDLRAALARALGDPSLDVGYRLGEAGVFVDPHGRELVLPAAGSDRAVTYVDYDGDRIAALVHDVAVLNDPSLQEAVAAATRLAAANSRLQGEVRARVTDLEASRKRILESRDDERRRLERRLHDGAEHRLREVAGLLQRGRGSSATAATIEPLVRAEEHVRQAVEDLARLAQGIHPRVLSEEGLRSAVHSLVEALPIAVDVQIEAGRPPPAAEAAAYFVCAEGLANVVKYASALRVRISVVAHAADLSVVVEDDGVGGADPSRGTGLRGLADRVATLGGSVRIGDAPGGGTRLVATIPFSRS